MNSFYFTDIFTKFMSVGFKKFTNKIDLTDPCYNKDVWCRTSVEALPGNYVCFARRYEGRIVATAIINIDEVKLTRDNLKELFFEEYAEIGVDSGMAGYFNNKPDYHSKSFDNWPKFCDLVLGENYQEYFVLDFNSNGLVVDGFFSQTCWGDGCYPVYVAKNNNNNVVAVAMLFDEF